jgi:hypothetical protein
MFFFFSSSQNTAASGDSERLGVCLSVYVMTTIYFRNTHCLSSFLCSSKVHQHCCISIATVLAVHFIKKKVPVLSITATQGKAILNESDHNYE